MMFYKKIKINLILDLLILFLLLVILIGIASVFYYYFEGLNKVDSFYFAVSTLTTIGYGDFYPTHDISKIFTAFYGLFGVFVFLSFVTVLGAKLVDLLRR